MIFSIHALSSNLLESMALFWCCNKFVASLCRFIRFVGETLWNTFVIGKTKQIFKTHYVYSSIIVGGHHQIWSSDHFPVSLIWWIHSEFQTFAWFWQSKTCISKNLLPQITGLDINNATNINMDNLQIKGKQGTLASIYFCLFTCCCYYVPMNGGGQYKNLSSIEKWDDNNGDHKTNLTSCQPLILAGAESKLVKKSSLPLVKAKIFQKLLNIVQIKVH